MEGGTKEGETQKRRTELFEPTLNGSHDHVDFHSSHFSLPPSFLLPLPHQSLAPIKVSFVFTYNCLLIDYTYDKYRLAKLRQQPWGVRNTPMATSPPTQWSAAANGY
jgi:hypothetical protein